MFAEALSMKTSSIYEYQNGTIDDPAIILKAALRNGSSYGVRADQSAAASNAATKAATRRSNRMSEWRIGRTRDSPSMERARESAT